MTEAEQPVVVEVTVAAPIERVWASLRDPDLIRLWHGWHYDELAQEIDVIFVKDAEADEAGHTLQLSDGDRFELVATAGGTMVRVVRAPYVPGTEWSEYYHEITEGWRSFLQQLRFMQDVHPGEQRRTIFLSGSGAAGTLDDLVTSVPSAVSETPYFVGDHQRGLLLPALGPGLLILASKPVAGDDRGRGLLDAMAIVTMYGLTEDDFAKEVERWSVWWRSGYPEAAPAQV